MIALPVPPHCTLTSAGARSALFSRSAASGFCLFALFAGFSHARAGHCGADQLTSHNKHTLCYRAVLLPASLCAWCLNVWCNKMCALVSCWEVCACLDPWLRIAFALMCQKHRLNKSGADSGAEGPANRTSSGNSSRLEPHLLSL